MAIRAAGWRWHRRLKVWQHVEWRMEAISAALALEFVLYEAWRDVLG